jgi:hypothetical protein
MSSVSATSSSAVLTALLDNLTGSSTSKTSTANTATTDTTSATQLMTAIQDSGSMKSYFSSSIGAALLSIDSGSTATNAVDNLLARETELQQQVVTAYKAQQATADEAKTTASTTATSATKN